MVKTIRPSKFFALVPETAAKDRLVTMKIPIRRDPNGEDGSCRLLELMVLIAAMRIVNVRRVFEFGTYLGNTTLHLALNSSAEIWTMDAPTEVLEARGLADTYKLRDSVLKEYVGMHFAATRIGGPVQEIWADSLTWIAPEYWRGAFDLMFIDGDHSAEAVAADTANAFHMLSPNGAIFWHDYGNSKSKGNTEFLDDCSGTMNCFHIEDTMLLGYFADPALFERL